MHRGWLHRKGSTFFPLHSRPSPLCTSVRYSPFNSCFLHHGLSSFLLLYTSRTDKGLVMGGSPWKSIFAVLQRESAQGSYFLFFYKAWFTQVARGTQRPIGKVLLNGGHLADTKSDRGFYNFLFVTATGKSHAIRLTTRHERDLWVQKISDVLRRSS